MTWLRRAIYLLIAVAILIQAGVIATEYLFPWWRKITEVGELDSWERSVRLASWLYPENVEYFKFLRNQIPESAVVIIPPRGTYLPYGWINNMNYNLFPRRLRHCAPKDFESCVQGIAGDEIFILRVRDYPPPEFVTQMGDYVSHSQELGFIHYQVP